MRLEKTREDQALRAAASKALYERATAVIPGGVTHGIRYFPPFPFYVTRARGSRIWDADGNELLDFWIGHLALILGHSPSVVVQALQEQLDQGTQWGTASAREVELAEAVQRTVPCAETVRFCNTGAEATMYAARLARGFTGRSVILKAEGGWHGFCTDLLVAVHPPFDEPESLGLPRALTGLVGTFPFNDVEAATDAIRRQEDLAAVIVEPVLGAGGSIPADPDFLRALQEETEARDALLICDEVITGYRLGLGGAQAHYGVIPDLVTLGKILGGGLPVGAVAGSADTMALTDPRREGGKVAIGGGTFSSNPLTLVAGLATLRHLEAHPGLYEALGRMGTEIRRQVPVALAEGGVPAVATGIASMFQVHFPKEEGVEIRSARDVAERTDPHLREEAFKRGLVNRGVYTVHGGGGLCEAHTDADVQRLVEAVEGVAEEMRG